MPLMILIEAEAAEVEAETAVHTVMKETATDSSEALNKFLQGPPSIKNDPTQNEPSA